MYQNIVCIGIKATYGLQPWLQVEWRLEVNKTKLQLPEFISPTCVHSIGICSEVINLLVRPWSFFEQTNHGHLKASKTYLDHLIQAGPPHCAAMCLKFVINDRNFDFICETKKANKSRQTQKKFIWSSWIFQQQQKTSLTENKVK